MTKKLSRLSLLAMIGFAVLIFADKNPYMLWIGFLLLIIGAGSFGILIARKQHGKALDVIEQINKDLKKIK